MTTLKIIALNKSISSKLILKEISVEFSSGINIIIGLNGSGKSTLLNCILSICDFESGLVEFNGIYVRFISTY